MLAYPQPMRDPLPHSATLFQTLLFHKNRQNLTNSSSAHLGYSSFVSLNSSCFGAYCNILLYSLNLAQLSLEILFSLPVPIAYHLKGLSASPTELSVASAPTTQASGLSACFPIAKEQGLRSPAITACLLLS
ncbi:hypothetical protein KIL84_013083 [Mauremys mutica]|uniref:Uncharacterized protein n=1 Tax=Mauremys mutica TaxID=74926 RepID=A0A9D4B1Y5_9SAUR|nr:hypothetical protein KIL84_013083 [Mauremys mutica]